MKVLRGSESSRPDRGTAVTIGVFDGVHLGHRHLVRAVIEEARRRDLLAGVVTLDPHPLQVLKPDVELRLLTTLEERLRRLASLGPDFTLVYPFSPRTAITSADNFVSGLQRELRMEALVVGPDFALGHQRQGDTGYLAKLGADRGFAFRVVEPLLLDGEPVKSRRIRALISAGRVRAAGRLLGQPATLEGEVRSKEPLVENRFVLRLAVPRLLILPPDGVYGGEIGPSRAALIQVRGREVAVGMEGPSPARIVATLQQRLELEPISQGPAWEGGWNARLAPRRAQAGEDPA